MCLNRRLLSPLSLQVYGGVRVKSEEHLVTELGSPKILPVVLDIHESETIEAALAKVREAEKEAWRMYICEPYIDDFCVDSIRSSPVCLFSPLALPPSQVKSELEGRAFTALVNTIEAGGSTSPMETQDLPSLKRLLETNTVGTLGLVQIFLPLIRYLLLLLLSSPIPPTHNPPFPFSLPFSLPVFFSMVREQGSRVVLMSSLCAHLTPPLFGGLCASKAALESLADAMRRELAPFQISISSIEPAVASPAEEKEGGGRKGRRCMPTCLRRIKRRHWCRRVLLEPEEEEQQQLQQTRWHGR